MIYFELRIITQNKYNYYIYNYNDYKSLYFE